MSNIATTHLVVEHGLENAAVISFLRNSWSGLNSVEKRQLLGISYNNLVDWHIQIQSDKVSFVYNRGTSLDSISDRPISSFDFDNLRKTAFEQIVGTRPSPNLPALDEALIQMISRWKRSLPLELGSSLRNEDLSALFNAIIFVRALEDHYRRYPLGSDIPNVPLLRNIWNDKGGQGYTFRDALLESVLYLPEKEVPAGLLDIHRLTAFDKLEKETVSALIGDFYRNTLIPYEYDFSIMSKHALSRIYEHYVSILRPIETPQLNMSFLPRLPEETWERGFGSIYTPQFVARFFARYLREQMTPSAFRRIRSIDPACGSGIFLRTLLEIQCDPTQDGVRLEHIQSAFQNVTGIDIDENASQSARLSLALLYLVLTGTFPPPLNIITTDAVEHFEQNLDLKGIMDAVLANPPFVAWDAQSLAVRQNITRFMSPYSRGKMDLYLAFLVLGIELLKPGGFGLFVVPHNFLLANNAKKVRSFVRETCSVRCLADLSAIRVFGDTGSYVVLLIIQKKSDSELEPPPAIIVKCQDLVGQALQDAVEGRYTQNAAYSVYEAPQSTFLQDTWIVLPAVQETIERKLASLPTLDQYMHIRTGVITGADDVFILEADKIPPDDAKLFVPLLRDRDMQVYNVPPNSNYMVFYPYENGAKIDEQLLQNGFPATWDYLSQHREKLEKRKSIKKYKRAWWEPMWSRPPENMLIPKIVTPHLSIVPRFSLDARGHYAVTRAPLLYPKNNLQGAEQEILKYFLAVLNSTTCYWYISNHSHKYGGGYAKLEPVTLKRTPIPDPMGIPQATMLAIQNLIERRLNTTGPEAFSLEQRLDSLVADVYGLTPAERHALGVE